MYDSSTELPALISSRICHDLASPLGAIANGLELLELSGFGDTPEASLLSDSVAAATARIEFFRIAYGPANSEAMISAPIAHRTLTQNFANKRLSIHWGPTTDIARPTAKLLFLLVQVADSALPYGGDIEIQHAGAQSLITCTGRETRLSPELWSHLSDETPPESVQSSQVQFALARQQAKTLDRTITVTDEGIKFLISVS